jgi:hypothetical protein
MTTNKLRSFLFLSLWLGLSTIAKAQQACRAEEFAAVIYYAQGLDPLTEGLGKKMLACANRDYRESSLFWLAFYYSMTEQRAKIPSLVALMPRQVLSDPKLIAQSAALNGNSALLSEQVEAGTLGYVDDPWVLVTLARAQMIAEQYKPALTNYGRVLKIRENQDTTEIELLYSYIWAKDREAALTKLATLRRYSSQPYMQQSLDRAERLLKVTEGKPEARHDLFALAYVQERDNRGYAAVGGRIDYHGPVGIEVEALEHTVPFEEDKDRVVSITLSREWGREEGLQAITDIGYYSEGDDHVTGLLGARYHRGHVFEGGVAVRRKEVSAFERPPLGERAGLMRDSFLWDLGLYQRLFVAGAVHSEDEVIFEDYHAELRMGALLSEETETGLGIFVPITYRHRPLASPDYRSYPHDLRVGLGLRLGLGDHRNFLARAEAAAESIQRDDYGAVDSYEPLLGARAKLHLRYSLATSYYGFFEGSAYIIEKATGEKADERGSEFLVGIGLTQPEY